MLLTYLQLNCRIYFIVQKPQPTTTVGGGGVSASGYLITDPTIDSVKTPAGVVVELVTGSIAQQQVHVYEILNMKDLRKHLIETSCKYRAKY